MTRRRWTADEDELLERLAGEVGITRIAKRLGRSVGSVSSHAAALGISWKPIGVYSLNELTTIIGTSDYRQIRAWVEEGRLEGKRNRGRGRWGTFVVSEAALVRFLRANPHLVDRTKVDRAYQQFVDERWITLGEAFERGAAHVVTLEAAYRSGLLEARHRGQRIVIPERILPILVAGRRRIIGDIEHRRRLTRYQATQRARRPIRRRAYYEAKAS